MQKEGRAYAILISGSYCDGCAIQNDPEINVDILTEMWFFLDPTQAALLLPEVPGCCIQCENPIMRLL